jgi:hypothetical protein
MLSDERLVKVERLVSESLNEDASLQKVCSLSTCDQDGVNDFSCQSGIEAINARVYAVKASMSRSFSMHIVT